MTVQVAAHAFQSRQGSRDLQELYQEQHSYPSKLCSRPEGQDNGVRIFMQYFAEIFRQDIAFNAVLQIRNVCQIFLALICGIGESENKGLHPRTNQTQTKAPSSMKSTYKTKCR